MKSLLARIYNKQQFQPSFLGIFINPFYFARRGLYTSINELSLKITGKILDVGCGRKPYLSLFRYDSYIGMDIELSGHDHKNEFIDVFYDGKTFPFESSVFDSIICNEVFEHVFNPDEFIKEINRVLKIGGYFLISVPFIWAEHEQPFDYARYSSFGLKSILERNGFTAERHLKTVTDIRTIFQLMTAYLYVKLSTRNFYVNIFITLIFISPISLIGQLVSFFLPKNNDLYLDNVFLVKKIANV